MSDLSVFAFDTRAVRVVMVDGEPWFVGKDVAEVLGYSDTVNAIKQHCKGVVKRHPTHAQPPQIRLRRMSSVSVRSILLSSSMKAKMAKASSFDRGAMRAIERKQ